jgi:hypothetical protein
MQLKTRYILTRTWDDFHPMIHCRDSLEQIVRFASNQLRRWYPFAESPRKIGLNVLNQRNFTDHHGYASFSEQSRFPSTAMTLPVPIMMQRGEGPICSMPTTEAYTKRPSNTLLRFSPPTCHHSSSCYPTFRLEFPVHISFSPFSSYLPIPLPISFFPSNFLYLP